ncbi:MAG: NUDIX hydrolase [Chloroflexi bacterium]|nr:NUDIX hydrolase [Chloroflexota bacterium]
MTVERALSSRRIFQGRVVGLRVDEVEFPNGGRGAREVVEHGEAVVIVPLDGQGNVLLVRQFRYALGRDLLELPAGGIDPGEKPEEAALREMREETGYEVGALKRIGGFYSAPGFCTEFLHLFLARDLRPGVARPEEDEEISLVPVPLSSVPDLVRRGEVRDAKSIAGLLQALYL